MAPAVTRQWAQVILVALVVASGAAVAALLAPESPSRPALPKDPWAVAGPLVVAELSVTKCPTSFGVRESRHVTLPVRVRADVSVRLAHEVSTFTDGLGTLDVVAPSTWRCTALDAVDGSSTLVVYPPGSPTPKWGHVTAVKRGIVASQTGGCVGCSLETACPLFAAANHRYVTTYGLRCHRAASGDERRTTVSSSRVLFVDPPGVKGAGRPSGGGFAAYGAMLWHVPGDPDATAWLDTCTLPDADHDLCVLSVRAFLSRRPSD